MNSTEPNQTNFFGKNYQCTSEINDEKKIDTRNELAKEIVNRVNELWEPENLEIVADFSNPQKGLQKHVVQILVFLDRNNTTYKKVHLKLGDNLQEICTPFKSINYKDGYLEPYAELPENYNAQGRQLKNDTIPEKIINFEQYQSPLKQINNRMIYEEDIRQNQDDMLENMFYDKHHIWKEINKFTSCKFNYQIFPNSESNAEMIEDTYKNARNSYIKQRSLSSNGDKSIDEICKAVEEEDLSEYQFYNHIKKLILNKLENPQAPLVMPDVYEKPKSPTQTQEKEPSTIVTQSELLERKAIKPQEKKTLEDLQSPTQTQEKEPSIIVTQSELRERKVSKLQEKKTLEDLQSPTQTQEKEPSTIVTQSELRERKASKLQEKKTLEDQPSAILPDDPSSDGSCCKNLCITM